MKNEVKHTAHSRYRCEYHIVFVPKYRRKIIYKEVRRDVIEIIKKLCKEMKVEIIEASSYRLRHLQCRGSARQPYHK